MRHICIRDGHLWDRIPKDNILIKQEGDWLFYLSKESREIFVDTTSANPGYLFFNKADLVELLDIIKKGKGEATV
jgi:hypothetical protein